MSDDLIVQRPEGLYCPPGDFYIDPWRRVDRAVITHAHADHARSGTWEVQAKGVPVSAGGTLRLSPGPGRTTIVEGTMMMKQETPAISMKQ